MDLQGQERFLVTQKLTMMVNRYVVTAPVAGAEGDGQVVAFAEQKRMAFKEQVTVYTDQSKSVPLFGFKARQVMDFGATYDVVTPDGSPIGLFRKQFKKSLLRSTWQLEQAGVGTSTGQERNQGVAIIRRIWDFLPIIGDIPVPFIFHFDFTLDGADRPVMTVEKRWGFRDRYDVQVTEPALDRRLVIAMAIGLDALQSR
jgi:uncharacterized protein YxjI